MTKPADLPTGPHYMLTLELPFSSVHTLLRPSFTKYKWHRNINLFSIRLRIIASA